MPTQYVPDPSVAPWLPVVHLSVTFPDGVQAWGSGVVVGRNDVLTASHMVYSAAHGGSATRVEVEPAFNPRTGTGPLGEFLPVAWTYSTAYDPDGDGRVATGDGIAGASRGGTELDIALLDFAVPIGDWTGWYAVDFANAFRSGTASVAGYPNAWGNVLVTDQAAVSDDGRDWFVNTGGLNISPGSSGGPVFVETAAGRMVVGIVSTTIAAADPAGLDWIARHMAENDALIGVSPATGGNATPDYLTGTVRNDVLDGGAGNDTLLGMEGNDWLAGGTGVNLVVGGPGVDTLALEAPFRHAVLTRTEQSATTIGGAVVHSFGGTAGGSGETTTYSEIENFAFLDGRLVFDPSDPAMQVYRAYQATLGRAPDSLGLNEWTATVEAGQTLTAVVRGLLASPEFGARYGAPDASGFVAQAYQNVLDRAPTSSELQGWVNAMRGGYSREGVLVGFSESAEFKAKVAARLPDGLWDQDEGASSVARLYQAALGRRPDEAGLRAHGDALDSGTPLKSVATFFAASPEFAAKYGPLDDAGYVARLYHNVLGRAPEAGGVEGWVGQLHAGTVDRADVLLGFSESAEFKAASQPWLEGGIVFA